MPDESANKLMTELRKKVTNLEELKRYLNAHQDSEYPFVEIAWNDAVRKCKENEGDGKNMTFSKKLHLD